MRRCREEANWNVGGMANAGPQKTVDIQEEGIRGEVPSFALLCRRRSIFCTFDDAHFGVTYCLSTHYANPLVAKGPQIGPSTTDSARYENTNEPICLILNFTLKCADIWECAL